MSIMPKTLNTADLAQFTGSENWYRHGINRRVLFTDGAKYVADHAGAYWLLDEIAIIQPHNLRVAAEEFQVWKLTVNADQTAVLTCDDGNGNVVYTKKIEHTDFPIDGITLYFTNNTILLPREY
jgi:phage baseplate assembly protein gpV